MAIAAILSPSLSLGFNMEAPKDLNEAKGVGESVVEKSKEILPGTLQNIWKENVLPVWEKMYQWFQDNIWIHFKGWFEEKIEPKAKEEIDKRVPHLKDEFEKEKQEIKDELPAITNTLWSKAWEFIKNFTK